MTTLPLFQSGGFAGAGERARANGLWLIVDATAEWCGPCKQMDKVTWRDGDVLRWFDGNALAVQVDVDAEEELARKLEIRAMPTIIAFKDGQEKDRVVGYRDPRGLLDWLGGLERGETDLDRLRRSVIDPEHDMNDRLMLAKGMLAAGHHEEATDEFEWLWRNIANVDPGMTGVRLSFMASEIGSLIAAYPPARERFTRIRDQTADGLAAAGDAVARLDWMVLNGLLDEDDRTVAWYDTVKDDPAHPIVAGCAHHLVGLLGERKRWADIGRLYADPLRELANHHRMSEPPPDVEIPPEMLAPLKTMMAQQFRDAAALLSGCLRAAGRGPEAEALGREAVRLDPSDEMKQGLAEAPTTYA
jgi:thioredoxin 1